MLLKNVVKRANNSTKPSPQSTDPSKGI